MVVKNNQINLKLIYCALSSVFLLIGCNSGVAGSPGSPIVAVDKPAELGNIKKVSLFSASNKDYDVLPNLEIGYGFDPDTNTIRIPSGYSSEAFIANSDSTIGDAPPASVIISEAPTYHDFIDTVGNSDANTNEQSSSFSGGMGASYGLYSASVKAGYAEASLSKSAQLTIKKRAGVVVSKAQYLPLDASRKDYSPKDRTRTAEALLNGVGGLRDAINNIDKQTDPYLRRIAIKEFYQNYGSHAITSVTKGYIGYHNLTLTQKTSGGSSSSNLSTQSSFSSPYVKGEFSSEQTEASAFEKANWDLSANTTVAPNNSEMYNQVMDIYKSIDDELKSSTIIDFSSLGKAEIGNKIDTNKFNFSRMNVTPSPEAIKEFNASKNNAKFMTADIDALKDLNDLIATTIAERDSATPEVKVELNKKLKDLDIRLSSFLSKFDSGGTYASLTLNTKDAPVVERANLLHNTLTSTTTSSDISKATADLNKEKERIKKEQGQQKKNADKIAFSNWLKTVIYPREKKDSQTVAQWFATLKPADISTFNEEWKVALEKEELVDKDAFAQVHQNNAIQFNNTQFNNTQFNKQNSLRKINFNSNGIMRLSQQTNKIKKLTLEADGQPVVIDFNIVPWSEIFPELSSTALDNSGVMMQSKLMQQIDDFMLDRSYLQMVINVDKTNPGALSQIANADAGLIDVLGDLYNKLKELGSSENVQTISFNGIKYDMDDISQAAKLSIALEDLMNNSKMKKSSWYKVVSVLKSKGIINQYGALIGIHKGNPYNETGEPFKPNQTYIALNDDSSAHSKRIKTNYVTPTMSMGLQLGQYYTETAGTIHPIVPSALPIVTANTELSNCSVLGECVQGLQIMNDSTLMSRTYPESSSNYGLILSPNNIGYSKDGEMAYNVTYPNLDNSWSNPFLFGYVRVVGGWAELNERRTPYNSYKYSYDNLSDRVYDVQESIIGSLKQHNTGANIQLVPIIKNTLVDVGHKIPSNIAPWLRNYYGGNKKSIDMTIAKHLSF